MKWKLRWPDFNFPPINLWNAPKAEPVESVREIETKPAKITKADPTDIIKSILRDR